MNEEQKDRLKAFLDMMNFSNAEQNALIVEHIKKEGLTFIKPTAENAPDLERRLGTVRFGNEMMKVQLSNVPESIVRDYPSMVEFLVSDAIDSIKRTVFKDDLYRANGLK